MASKRATSVAEANAQTFTLPTSLDDNWRGFAGLLDGYQIGEELGFNVMTWSSETLKPAMASGQFTDDTSILDLRLILFGLFRSDYFSGWTYHEHDREVDFVLQALSVKTGQPYTPHDFNTPDNS